MLNEELKGFGIDEKTFMTIQGIIALLCDLDEFHALVALGLATDAWGGKHGKSKEEVTDMLKALISTQEDVVKLLGVMPVEDIPTVRFNLGGEN